MECDADSISLKGCIKEYRGLGYFVRYEGGNAFRGAEGARGWQGVIGGVMTHGRGVGLITKGFLKCDNGGAGIGNQSMEVNQFRSKSLQVPLKEEL